MITQKNHSNFLKSNFCKNHQDQIDYLKSWFQILKNWEIKYEESNEYYSQCCINVEDKKASIYPWVNEKIPNDYFIHEILHCALKAFAHIKNTREDEEELIRDLCAMVIPVINTL